MYKLCELSFTFVEPPKTVSSISTDTGIYLESTANEK